MKVSRSVLANAWIPVWPLNLLSWISWLTSSSEINTKLALSWPCQLCSLFQGDEVDHFIRRINHEVTRHQEQCKLDHALTRIEGYEGASIPSGCDELSKVWEQLTVKTTHLIASFLVFNGLKFSLQTLPLAPHHPLPPTLYNSLITSS